MNEIKQVLIFKYDDTSLDRITRLIKQVQKHNIAKIIIVGNITNIDPLDNITLVETKNRDKLHMLSLGLKHISTPFVLLNSNMLLENDLIKYILGADFDGKNVLFTSSKLKDNFFVLSDSFANVTNISYNSHHKDCFTNILRISTLDSFKENYSNNNLIKLLSFKQAGIEPFYFTTEVTNSDVPCDYLDVFENVSFVDVNKLIRIEDHNASRVNELKNNILEQGYWTQPIIVEKNDFMILDGHHRFEVAKLLNLKKIPAILVDYDDIYVWSLRKEIAISQELVRINAVENNQIYPYKTVKHKFPFTLPTTNYMLGELKND